MITYLKQLLLPHLYILSHLKGYCLIRFVLISKKESNLSINWLPK